MGSNNSCIFTSSEANKPIKIMKTLNHVTFNSNTTIEEIESLNAGDILTVKESGHDGIVLSWSIRTEGDNFIYTIVLESDKIGSFELSFVSYDSTLRYEKTINIDKQKLGRPFGTTKEPTFKPSLRCKVDAWKKLQEKYPKKLNRMFNEWINSLLN